MDLFVSQILLLLVYIINIVSSTSCDNLPPFCEKNAGQPGQESLGDQAVIVNRNGPGMMSDIEQLIAELSQSTGSDKMFRKNIR